MRKGGASGNCRVHRPLSLSVRRSPHVRPFSADAAVFDGHSLYLCVSDLVSHAIGRPEIDVYGDGICGCDPGAPSQHPSQPLDRVIIIENPRSDGMRSDRRLSSSDRLAQPSVEVSRVPRGVSAPRAADHDAAHASSMAMILLPMNSATWGTTAFPRHRILSTRLGTP